MFDANNFFTKIIEQKHVAKEVSTTYDKRSIKSASHIKMEKFLPQSYNDL